MEKICAQIVIVAMVIAVSWTLPPGDFCAYDVDCSINGTKCVQVTPGVKRCMYCLCQFGDQCQVDFTQANENGNLKKVDRGNGNNNGNQGNWIAYGCDCSNYSNTAQPFCEPTCDHSSITCGMNTVCSDVCGTTPASCTCLSGYEGVPEQGCSDINECETGTDICYSSATCTNTEGSFYCTCNTGYVGDGVSCIADLNCDFSDGLCWWTQSDGDTFDWRRRSGDTPSSNTGPTGDNTGENGLGFYMYIETSLPITLSDTAILVSPTLSAGESYCFTLATNMYGATMGSIDIILQNTLSGAWTVIETFDNATPTPVWIIRNIDILPQSNDFKILILATVGVSPPPEYYSWRSDAAIDDLQLRTGNC